MLRDDDATQIFVEESEEHLADIESDLLAIEKGGSEIDDDLVNKVFRAVHTVKGGAGFLGYETIKTLAHRMENLMGMIRGHKLDPTPAICSVLLGSADSLRNMIQNLESSNDADVSRHIFALTAIVEGGAAPQDQTQEQTAKPVTKKVDIPAATASAPERKIHEAVEVPVVQMSSDSSVPLKEIPQKKITSRQEKTSADGSLRVNVRLLDQLMTLAGELVLSRNQLVQAVSSKNMTSIEVVKQRIDLITSELQEAVMFTRMQPIGKVFNLFPRLTRELSLDLGKEVELVVEGEDVELDKTIIESINGPLTHLIRNSIDHGIEMPAERELARKDKVGRIILRASHKAGLVILDVIDDGRGMSPEKIASAVVKKGILDEDQIQLLSDKEKLNLIFLPGFSTTESVSEISGRGVGMDVVKTNLDKLGGQVDISSTPGKGTAIQIKLPLTLAIISAQIIICRNERYSIPQVNLEELIRVAAHEVKDKIEVIGKSPVLKLRGDLLPLVKLMDVLGGRSEYVEHSTGDVKKERRQNIADRRSFKTKLIHEQRKDGEGGQTANYAREERERRGKSGMLYIAIVNAGNLKYGLVVDGLLDAEEVVVKPLGLHLQGIKKYSGATIMGDGRVSLILDVGNIAREAGLVSFENSERARQLSLEMQDSARKLRDVQSFLLFRNGGTEQFCVPLHLVLRVIKIKSFEIEHAGGKRVLQYCGDSLPLFSIDEVADITPLKDHDDLLVIIFHVTGRQVGLLATKPVNAIEMFLSVDDETYHQPGIMGSVIIEKRITLLVNIYEVVKILNPHWFASKNELVPMIDKHTILVADDSAFFQSLIAKTLREEGFHVIVAEDGQVALEKLRENAQKFSMLVTDIEMPRLNGFELTTKIREDPVFVNLPIIAITTLAGEEDRQRGQMAGVNEYLVKFDRDLLLRNVLKLLRIK